MFTIIFSLLGTLLTYFFVKFYPSFFEKRLFNDAKEVLEEFGAKITGTHHKKELKLNFFELLVLFAVLFGGSYLIIGLNLTMPQNLILHALLLASLNVGYVDFKTRWLNNECCFVIMLIGLLFSVYFENYLLNFVIASMVIYLILIPLLSYFSIGQGDLVLFSTFFLFLPPLEASSTILVAGVIGFVYILLFILYFTLALLVQRRKKGREITLNDCYYSTKVLLKLNPPAFGQWLLLGLFVLLLGNLYQIAWLEFFR